MNQPRIPAGPHGGEFTTVNRPEADATLDTPSAIDQAHTDELAVLDAFNAASLTYDQVRAAALRATAATHHKDAASIVMHRDMQNDRVRFHELRDSAGNPIDTDVNFDGYFRDADDDLLGREFSQLDDEDADGENNLYSLNIGQTEHLDLNAILRAVNPAWIRLGQAEAAYSTARAHTLQVTVGETHPDAARIVMLRDTQRNRVHFIELIDGDGDHIETTLLLDGQFNDAYDSLLQQFEQIDEEENEWGESRYELAVKTE